MALLKIEEPGQATLEEKNADLVVGIDLGTTNSLVGMVVNDEVRFFADLEGGELHASVVGFGEDGEVLAVGNAARDGDFAHKVSSVKRLMGKGIADVDAAENFADLEGELKIIIGEKKYSAAEISAQILLYLKNLVVGQLGDLADRREFKAVITVPAHFDEGAKNATKLAAKLAGIEVLRLVNEPTAAALAYGLDSGKEGVYGVYDFGGGTFDVSVLKMQKGVFRVLGVAGDNELGGDDIDLALAGDFFGGDLGVAKGVKEGLGGGFDEKGNVTEGVRRLVQAAGGENEGSALPLRDEDSIVDAPLTPALSPKGRGSDYGASDQEIESVIAPFVEKTVDLTRGLVADLEIGIGGGRNELKGLILVGGSSRLSLVKRRLGEEFLGAEIFTDLDPDMVVAQGAVLQAHQLSGGGGGSLLLDVVALSLGVEMMGGVVDKIIQRNTTIPIAMAKEFTTYADNQTGLKLHIVQGEREFAKDCRSLARFEINGIPPMRAGLARVLVSFKVDADGLLTVTAKEEVTGQEQEIVVKPTYGIDEGKVKEMLLDSMKNAKNDMRERLVAEVRREAGQDLDFVRRDLRDYPQFVEEDEKREILRRGEELERVLADENATKEEIEEAKGVFEGACAGFSLRKANESLKAFVGEEV